MDEYSIRLLEVYSIRHLAQIIEHDDRRVGIGAPVCARRPATGSSQSRELTGRRSTERDAAVKVDSRAIPFSNEYRVVLRVHVLNPGECPSPTIRRVAPVYD